MTTPSDIRAALDSIPETCGCGQSSCKWLLRHDQALRQCLRFTLGAMEEPSEEMLVAAITCWPTTEPIPMWKAIWCAMTTALFEQVSNETLTTKGELK